MMGSQSGYRYIRFTADPTIQLGNYKEAVEKLWLSFQIETREKLRERGLNRRERRAYIALFNREHLPEYHGIVLAVTENGDPVGYGALAKVGREAGYTSVYVDPLHRRNGVFGGITDEVISLARESRASILHVNVTSEQLPPESLLRRGFREAPPDPMSEVEGTPFRMRL